MTQAKICKTTFCIAVLALGIAALPAAAFNPQPEPPGSVAIGLISDQFARITVTNSTDRVSGILPCVCPVLLTLLDDSGTALGSQEMDVFPGEIGSFEFGLSLKAGERRIVRGLVEFTGGEGARLACNAGTRSGLEIADGSDGATVVAVPIVTTYLPALSE